MPHLSKAYSFKEHLRGRRKHSENVSKISCLHIRQCLAPCEHKGQADGLILHIIVKGLVRLMYREAIYHRDLSIFKMFHISLPFPRAHAFKCSTPTQVRQSSEGFFISTWLDEQREIEMEEKSTWEWVKEGPRLEREIKWWRQRTENFSQRKNMGKESGCAAKERSGVMESDTAWISSSDLPVTVSYLFRDKQKGNLKDLIGCARCSNSVTPAQGKGGWVVVMSQGREHLRLVPYYPG